MFKRRDIPPVLLLLLLIILVMLTLSQILVVHNGRYGKNLHNMRKLQLELRQMDINLHTMMMQNVPSIELNRRLLQNSINAQRVAQILAEAAQPDQYVVAPSKKPSTIYSVGDGDGGGGGVDAVESNERYPANSDSFPADVVVTDHREAAGAKVGIDGDDDDDDEEEDDDGRQELEMDDFDFRNGSVRGRDGITASYPTEEEEEETVEIVKLRTSLPNAVHDEFGISRDSSSQVRTARNASTNESITQDLHHPVFTNSASLNFSFNQNDTKTAKTNASRALIDQTSRKPYCPPVPPEIKGRIFINFEHKHDYTEADILAQNPELAEGGAWRPKDCIARHKVAIIIPYRDRKEHLTVLLSHLHPMLQRQQLDYRIYVVEQHGDYTFNKARIMNIAFVEALKQYSFQCFVFHDVDLVPEDDRNMYSCPLQPRHMSVAIDEMGYKLAYQELVGGVLSMRTEHFHAVNGYSNLYWGWGAEDDDMAYRIMYVGLKITRPPENVARYKMIKHTKRKPSDWRKRAKLLYTGTRRFQFDGLNSLQYKLLSIENNRLCTHILVDIGKPPRGF